MTAKARGGSRESLALEETEAKIVADAGPAPPFVGDYVTEFRLRDYFAAQAMRGLVGTVGVAAGEIPDRAYNIADRMLVYRKIKK